MIKIILWIVVSLIYGSFLQDENSLYTPTYRYEESNSRSMLSPSRMKRIAEDYALREYCLRNNFFYNSSMTQICLDQLSRNSIVQSISIINLTSREFYVNFTQYKSVRGYNGIGYFDGTILLYYLKSLPHRVSLKIFENVIDIINDVIEYENDFDDYRETFIDFLHNLDPIDTPLIASESKLAVAVWHPFLRNFTGIVWMKTKNDKLETQIQVEKINCTSYNGLTPEFDVNHIEMAACLHPLFLEELAITLSEEDKKQLYVVLVLSRDNKFFAKYLDYDPYDVHYSMYANHRVVGFRIPGHCKQNYQPLLNISFDGMSSYFFGKEYFDSSYLWYKECSLSEMLFVDRVQKFDKTMLYSESIKNNYCLQETTTNGIQKLRWPQTPKTKLAYPDSLCFDANFTVPSRKCSEDGFANFSQVDCVQNLNLPSNSTKIFYTYATKCYMFKNFSMILQHFHSTVLNLLDQHLYLMAIDCIWSNILIDCMPEFRFLEKYWCNPLHAHIKQNLKMFHASMNKGIEMARKLSKVGVVEKSMMTFFSYIQIHGKTDVLEIHPRYIYWKRVHFPFGMVIFKGDGNGFTNCQAKVLTSENMTMDYTLDERVEVIIIINANTSYYDVEPITILVMYDNIFPIHDRYIRSSRHIFVFSDAVSYIFDVEIKLYLKIINFNNSTTMLSHTGEGHWINISGTFFSSADIAIYEEIDDYCVREKYAIIYLNILSILLKTEKETTKLVEEPIDLLSAVSFSINTADTIGEIERIYHKHLLVFNTFRLTGSILSCVGTFIIFSSILTLKGWYKTRFNIIQLTTTLAIQLPFFLVNMEVSHIKILIFYYFMLCQFSCTSLIGYIQYTKYIAVFKSETIDRFKSLIVGWIIPLMVILASLLFYGGCLKCHLCHKNREIFMFFVFIPIVTIVIGNSIVYIVAMKNIWSSPKHGPDDFKLKIKVAIFLPFVLGFTWIFIAPLVAPWSWLTLSGLFLIHLILPSQAFALFVFVILLDKATRDQWKNYLGSIYKKRIKSTNELH